MGIQRGKTLKINKVKDFFLAIINGSMWTKLSCLFMGAGAVCAEAIF